MTNVAFRAEEGCEVVELRACGTMRLWCFIFPLHFSIMYISKSMKKVSATANIFVRFTHNIPVEFTGNPPRRIYRESSL